MSEILNRIIEWSADHPFGVIAATALLFAAGWYSATHIPLDAIPDLSETQVVVYSRWERSPDVIEDQVTYPLVAALIGAPKVKDVRAISDFGASYIYVVFEDGVDPYWARSRVLEYLARATPRLPSGVKTELGPDASGVGWIFQYALWDTSGKRSLADLRALQDWYLRYQLQSVPGVAEVASVGGFVRQYEVNVDPRRLQVYDLAIGKVTAAIRASNRDAGGRLLEFGGREYMVRGRGSARSKADLENIVLGRSPDGVPIRVADVAKVAMGPELRRGAADLDGNGDTVYGIVVTRTGESPLQVIESVKARLQALEPGLPQGVKIITTYDRSELILGTVANLKATLIEESIVVGLVILLFLWHLPSALIPILTIPITVIASFVPMKATGMTANALSLGGIAIAVGAMVDAAIVVVEQTHKRISEWERDGRHGDLRRVVIAGIQEVATPGFFSLLVIGVSFLPVLALEAEEGRLFRPLAYTKTLGMLAAALLAVTLDPALRLMFLGWKGRYRGEGEHPLTRWLIRTYAPVVRWSLRWKRVVIATAAGLVLATIPVFLGLGSEFMPSLDEGALLFMPVTMPGISLGEARRLMQEQDRILAAFPEVARVSGKVGRAETATDPAPPSMIESLVVLKSKQEWPAVPVWYDRWPSFLRPLLRRISPDRGSTQDLINRMDRALRAPGVSNAWTMPIRNRIDMQSTGIRTAVGVKVKGSDLKKLEDLSTEVEKVLRTVPGTRSAFAERVGEGYYLDFDWNREELARYGLTVDDAQELVTSAIGGEEVTTIIEGRERYSVSVRYQADFRSNIGELGQILVAAGGGLQVPLRQLAEIRPARGPAMVRNDGGMLTAYVYADVEGRDLGGYVAAARDRVRQSVSLPPGYTIEWSGQYASIERVRERLKLVVPLTLLLAALLLYINTHSLVKTGIVLLAVPFSAVGAIWLVAAAGYQLSVAVWVGLAALAGVDAETGVFMLLYLDLVFHERVRAGRMRTAADLEDAIVEGAAKRIRPKVMTVMAMLAGLAPILWADGPGADVMKRIAAPMVGGIFTSFALELVVYPPIYQMWRGRIVRSRAPGA